MALVILVESGRTVSERRNSHQPHPARAWTAIKITSG
jgi:hypothetical protein